jgi:outer membrane protein
MKTKATLFTISTIALLVAGSMVSCNQNKTADQSAQVSSTGPTKIVFINQDTLMSKYNYAKDMRTRLEDKGKSAQNDVGSRQQAVQRDIAEYQRGANTMSADQRASTEQRLQREGQEFQQYQQNATAQFQGETSDENKKLYDKVYTFAKQYAKDNGYKLVLTFQTGNTNLLYADPSLDVTADFVKKINDQYTKEKK